MCCEPIQYNKDEIVGRCPDCDIDVVMEHGKIVAAEGCPYSPVACNTCGWRPCDDSC